MLLKLGCDLSGMDEHITKIYRLLDDACAQKAGRECVLTCGRDGVHMVGSLHYVGRAVDLRTIDLAKAKELSLFKELKNRLGKDYDVVLESNHIHVEYDPKGG